MSATETRLPAPVIARTHEGVRRINARKDLRGIADVLETCFSADFGAQDFSQINEMRWLGSTGIFLWLFSALQFLKTYENGFIYQHNGKVVGHLTLQETQHKRHWLISNVAVAPEFRRKGVGRALMRTAVETARQQNAQNISLQVASDNFGAIELYQQIGFQQLDDQTLWKRNYSCLPAPIYLADLRPYQAQDYTATLRLLSSIRPNGTSWLETLAEWESPQNPLEKLNSWLVDEQKSWVVARQGEILAWLRLHPQGYGGISLELAIDPSHEAELLPRLLAHSLRRLPQNGTILVEYPRSFGTNAFLHYDFFPYRELSWMRLTPNG